MLYRKFHKNININLNELDEFIKANNILKDQKIINEENPKLSE